MRQAFVRRLRGSIPLLAALALVSSASAQTASGPRAPITEDPNRIREIRVELAWFGDPITFPCQLGACVQKGVLELRGYVPSTAIRERAVKLARQVCSLSVIDHLQVRPGTTAHPVPVNPEQLQ